MCEFWGHKITLPTVPKTVGNCNICDTDIFDREATSCECGQVVHMGCSIVCLNCGEGIGCKRCMTEDGEGNWFCPDECMAEYYEKENEQWK